MLILTKQFSRKSHGKLQRVKSASRKITTGASIENMSRHGNLPEFTGKDWSSYQDRLGFYFEANDIDDAAASVAQYF